MVQKMYSKLLFLVLMLWGVVAFAQDRTISGTVKDDQGQPLPGATVFVKGNPSVGTVTDENGSFTLVVPEGATLVVSFVGYQEAEIAVGNQTSVSVALKPMSLGEVVVTAYGIERTKNELPYAAQTVDGSQISQARDNNITNALSGRVAGVEIRRNNNMGGSTNVVVRGFKSITGNNQALFVIDGVPVDNSTPNSSNQQTGRGGYDYGNAAADINPDDIESITVLKGPAATALYGSRAANGVVMITTKKGKKGLGITVNTGVTFGSIIKSTFPTYQKKYGQGYGPYYEDPSGFFLYRDVDGDGNPDLVSPTSEDASYGAPFDPNLMVYDWEAFDPSSPNYQKPKPWVAAKNGPEYFLQKPVQTNNNIMINGGSDKGWYKLGYTRTDETGVLPNSELKKNYANFAAAYNVTNRLTATASVNLTTVKGKGRYGTGYDDNNMMTNFRQWWAVNVDLKELEDAFFRSGEKNVTWNWADPSSLVPIYWDNPYFVRYRNYENDSRVRTLSYAQLDYKATDWLNLQARASLDAYDEQQEERKDVGSVGVSSYSRFNRRYRETNYDFLARANKEFGALTVKGLFGVNIRRTTVESIYAATNGGLVIPGLFALSNSANPLQAPSEGFSDIQVNGVYAGATLGYDNFLFLDLTARRDESSTLPKGKNVYYYPSASFSFVFSELLDFDWLTGAKLRANYAEVGNTAPFNSVGDYFLVNSPFGNAALATAPSVKNNPDLKPERTRSYEVGLEAIFADGRIGFDVTYYKQNTLDQIIPAEVSRTTGYSSTYINAGNVQNQGWEVQLFGEPVRTDNFTWKISANWTRNRNKVIELAPGIDNIILASMQGGVSVNAALGQPYGTIRGSNFVYLNGQKVVNSTTGYYERTTTSNEIIGNLNPDWIAGVTNTFTYKNVSLSALIDMRQGGDVFSLDLYYGMATGLYPETAGLNDKGNPVRDPVLQGGGVLFPGVKPDGSPNDVYASAVTFGTFGYRRNPAAGFIYDASYIKLREVAFTYRFPEKITSRLGIVKGASLSIVGRNLAILHKNLPYADPEDGMSAGNIQGYQVGVYPTVRNIGFNLKVQF
ncbi:MAG: SusC/RagA family TonB-linked outer membrane protein [Chitinophagales bacterium]|nr:MAG: SusC/RagA family TonB-linked outer membrane protein [Chitinophagales bacterium]